MHAVKPEACTNYQLSPALGLTGGEDLKSVRTVSGSEEDESMVTAEPTHRCPKFSSSLLMWWESDSRQGGWK